MILLGPLGYGFRSDLAFFLALSFHMDLVSVSCVGQLG